MINNTYIDDSIIYYPDTDRVSFHGKDLPATKELMERAKEQARFGSMLSSWIHLSNDDVNKSTVLYSMLDGKLFYDKLCNKDRIRFADELFQMSNDDINYRYSEYRDYFKRFSDFIVRNANYPKETIEQGEDLQRENLADEYFEYLSRILENTERVTRKN